MKTLRHSLHLLFVLTLFYYTPLLAQNDLSSTNTASIKKTLTFKISDLMPNPASGSTSIQINAAENGSVKMTILSLDGKQVIEKSFQLNSGINNLYLGLGQLDVGTYLCRFETTEGVMMRKLIKTR